MLKTKIVCTIGPASQSREVLENLMRNGMDVARLNFAHGDLDGHKEVIGHLRSVATALGRRVAIMGDLPGPKMRIGRLSTASVELERGQPFVLETGDILGDSNHASMSFDGLPGTLPSRRCAVSSPSCASWIPAPQPP